MLPNNQERINKNKKMDSAATNNNKHRDRSLSVEDADYSINGIKGKYTGEINHDGKPHGNGSFVRCNGSGMTYVGEWNNGGRVKNGAYYNNGRLVGNVVWD